MDTQCDEKGQNYQNKMFLAKVGHDVNGGELQQFMYHTSLKLETNDHKVKLEAADEL